MKIDILGGEKMKKKLFALFLAVLTFCGLAGCSYSVDSEPSFTQSPVSSPTAYTPEPATPAPYVRANDDDDGKSDANTGENAEKTATGYAETKENTIHKNGRQNRHRIHYRYRG
jgi:lipoprotein